MCTSLKLQFPRLPSRIYEFTSHSLCLPHNPPARSMEEAYSLLKVSIEADPRNAPWVPRFKLRSVWDNINLREVFKSWGITLDDKELECIKENYLYLLSTLVFIRWRRWGEFKALFLDRSHALRDIKFPIQDRRQLLFAMDQSTAEKFCDSQYIFAHAVLSYQGVQNFPPKQIIPFQWSGHTKLGSGSRSAGAVFKELIPRECLSDGAGNLNPVRLRFPSPSIIKVNSDRNHFMWLERSLKILCAILKKLAASS